MDSTPTPTLRATVGAFLRWYDETGSRGANAPQLIATMRAAYARAENTEPAALVFSCVDGTRGRWVIMNGWGSVVCEVQCDPAIATYEEQTALLNRLTAPVATDTEPTREPCQHTEQHGAPVLESILEKAEGLNGWRVKKSATGPNYYQLLDQRGSLLGVLSIIGTPEDAQRVADHLDHALADSHVEE